MADVKQEVESVSGVFKIDLNLNCFESTQRKQDTWHVASLCHADLAQVVQQPGDQLFQLVFMEEN